LAKSTTYVAAKEGTRLYVEESGSGQPILFLHEYSGDHRSWTAQVAHFSRTHRCIVAAARGYPPSEVPADAARYGHEIAAADALAVLDGLGVAKAHVVGLSMGAYTGLLLAMKHPERMMSLLAASGGSGSHPRDNPGRMEEARKLADAMRAAGKFPADSYALGPVRIQLKRKNPAAWREFRDHLAEHPVMGAAHVLLQYVAGRPSLYTFGDALSQVTVPTLLMIGDEDDPVIEINIWLKRTMPAAGLFVRPNSGHLLNLEEPDAFNSHMAAFLSAVEADEWPARAPAATAKRKTG
jgi:pimeloyl-ACP methyl ester carboxylesterase